MDPALSDDVREGGLCRTTAVKDGAIEERMTHVEPIHLTLAITGASGAVFGREALHALEADPRVARVHFVASENSLRVMAEELGVSGRNDILEKLLGTKPTKTRQLSEADVGAAIASGSHPSSGMIVLPCSMGTLAHIAQGLADSLIARAADVTLKERRPLLLCVRETPFNRIHLRNMTLAAEAGATIFPVIPAFYNHPIDSTEMARQFVFRVLANFGLHQPGAYVWKAEA
jgi:4-hydroxy-3-polyprenylbenzoate decarboxylase